MKAFQWCGRTIAFAEGETIAAALLRADILSIRSGSDAVADGRVFCGIGTCQCCLVRDQDGSVFEACLTPAASNMRLSPPASTGERDG